MSGESLEDLLARLERERVEADRLYNDALTIVDRAIGDAPDLPASPRPYDAERVAGINRAWNILPEGPPPVDRSLKGRLRGFVWQLIGPSLEAQKRFNGELADHINRNVATFQEMQQAVAGLLDASRREFAALVRFESLLVLYLQTITLYVDTKDRSAWGRELRDRLVLTEQRILALKRDVEGLLAGGAPPAIGHADPTAASAAAGGQAFGTRLDEVTYVGFEDQFRGSEEDIRARLQDYVSIFQSASDVLDVGCGRGELLDLLTRRGVSARGVDTNRAMVDLCRARGFEVEEADALGYLERQDDGSLGGLVAIQVVEHFEPRYLLRFLETASHKLRSGAPMILETINPACWMAFFETYLRDPTHRWPLHPDTLRYLVRAAGFTKVDVQFREPVRDADRLDRVAPETAQALSTHGSEMARVIEAINAHADKLNARLFSAMDYAIVAEVRPDWIAAR